MTDPIDTIDMEHIKRFVHSAKVVTLRKQILALRAKATETRAKVDAYLAPVFGRFKFFNDLDHKPGKEKVPLTRADDLYLSTDEEQVKWFFMACDVAHKENGHNLSPGECPALIAEDEVRQAEKRILRMGREFFKVPFDLTTGEERAIVIALFVHGPQAEPQQPVSGPISPQGTPGTPEAPKGQETAPAAKEP